MPPTRISWFHLDPTNIFRASLVQPHPTFLHKSVFIKTKTKKIEEKINAINPFTVLLNFSKNSRGLYFLKK